MQGNDGKENNSLQHANQIFFCILQFTDDADSVGGNSLESLTAKDLTKYVYGVAKGMEYIVSKGVRTLLYTQPVL